MEMVKRIGKGEDGGEGITPLPREVTKKQLHHGSIQKRDGLSLARVLRSDS